MPPAKKAPHLTPRQQLFVLEYIKDFNATGAAIRAGFSKKTAQPIGSRLLSHVMVARAIAEKGAAKLNKLDVTTDRIIAEYAKLAFADIREVVDVTDQIIKIKDGESWPDHVAGAVAEVSETKEGLKVKLHSKTAALDALARINAMFKDKIELTGEVHLASRLQAARQRDKK